MPYLGLFLAEYSCLYHSWLVISLRINHLRFQDLSRLTKLSTTSPSENYGKKKWIHQLSVYSKVFSSRNLKKSKIWPWMNFSKFESFPEILQILWRGVEAEQWYWDCFSNFQPVFLETIFFWGGWRDILSSTSQIPFEIWWESSLYTCLSDLPRILENSIPKYF